MQRRLLQWHFAALQMQANISAKQDASDVNVVGLCFAQQKPELLAILVNSCRKNRVAQAGALRLSLCAM